MFQAGNDGAAAGPVSGRLFYAQPVFEKIVRRALAEIEGVRLEPLFSATSLGRLIFWWGTKRGERRLQLTVPIQVGRGWRIPELARRAQQAVIAEVKRLTDYEEVIVTMRVSGSFAPEEGGRL